MSFESWPKNNNEDAEEKKIENFESLKKFREEAGTLNARQFQAIGFNGEKFMITTASESIRNKDEMGLGYIDVALNAAQSKKLYESLKKFKEDIDKIPAEEKEGLSYDEISRIDDSKMSQARKEFGTLSVDGNGINTVVHDDDYRGLGPKVLLIMEALGSRGPEGAASIDIAMSAEDAKNLLARLEEDMNSIEKALQSEKTLES